MIKQKSQRRTLEAPTSAIVLDLVRIRRSVSSLLRKGVGVLPEDMVANAVVAILQRIICGQMYVGGQAGRVGLASLSSLYQQRRQQQDKNEPMRTRKDE